MLGYRNLLMIGLLVLPSAANALESLTETSMDVVSAAGLGHLLVSQESTPVPQLRALLDGIPQHPHASWNEHGIENNVDRSNVGLGTIDSGLHSRTNDASTDKVADINIRVDSAKDLSSSQGDNGNLRLNLATQIDSIAAINARHRPEDTASRGSYYVEQMQINSTVVINSNR